MHAQMQLPARSRLPHPVSLRLNAHLLNSRFQGRHLCRWCAVHMPHSSSGPATASPPLMAASGRPAAAQQLEMTQAWWLQLEQLPLLAPSDCDPASRPAASAVPMQHPPTNGFVGGSRCKLARIEAFCRAVRQPAAQDRVGCLNYPPGEWPRSRNHPSVHSSAPDRQCHLISMKWPPHAPGLRVARAMAQRGDNRSVHGIAALAQCVRTYGRGSGD